MSKVKVDKNKKWQRNLKFLFCGSCAGLSGTTLTYPCDVLGTRMAYMTTKTFRPTLPQVASKMVQQEGWKSLFDGLLLTQVSVVPYSALAFFFYKFLKVEVVNKYPHIAKYQGFNFMFGYVSSFLSFTPVYPLCILRRRMQV